MAAAGARTRVFVSYSHRDRKWLERVKVHLKPLVRERAIALWDDTRIAAGADWRSELTRELSLARVAILLVSADFLDRTSSGSKNWLRSCAPPKRTAHRSSRLS